MPVLYRGRMVPEG